MQWQITGAHRQTGDETTIVIDAEDQAQAERRAARRGILIESIQRLETQIEVEAANQEDESPAMFEYQPPPARHEAPAAAPQYSWIRTGARIIVIEGVLCMLAAVIAALVAVSAWASGDMMARPVAFIATIVFLAFLVIGTFLLMWAQLALAVRDIARNSFGKD